VRDAYADAVAGLYESIPGKRGYAKAAAKLAAQRLAGFSKIFGGHFAAALLQSPPDSFGVEYVRIYEVDDATQARKAFARAIEGRSGLGEQVETLPETSYKDNSIVDFTTTPPGSDTSTTILAAFIKKRMLIASGDDAGENIRKLIDASVAPTPGVAVSAFRQFQTVTADAPEKASGMAFFSITGFLSWAGRSGLPGTEHLRGVHPASGLAAWAVPGKKTVAIHLRIPAIELTELRKALFGNAPILDFPM
jgi:hypothetical protein